MNILKKPSMWIFIFLRAGDLLAANWRSAQTENCLPMVSSLVATVIGFNFAFAAPKTASSFSLNSGRMAIISAFSASDLLLFLDQDPVRCDGAKFPREVGKAIDESRDISVNLGLFSSSTSRWRHLGFAPLSSLLGASLSRHT